MKLMKIQMLFCSQLGVDISNIFTYIGYKDIFETNGVLDMHKVIVRITDGPGVDEDMTLDQIIAMPRSGDITWEKILQFRDLLWPWMKMIWRSP